MSNCFYTSLLVLLFYFTAFHQCTYGIFIFPRPTRTIGSHYRKSRGDVFGSRQPRKQPPLNLWGLNKFEDVVAAVITRLHSNSSVLDLASTSPNLTDSATTHSFLIETRPLNTFALSTLPPEKSDMFTTTLEKSGIVSSKDISVGSTEDSTPTMSSIPTNERKHLVSKDIGDNHSTMYYQTHPFAQLFSSTTSKYQEFTINTDSTRNFSVKYTTLSNVSATKTNEELNSINIRKTQSLNSEQYNSSNVKEILKQKASSPISILSFNSNTTPPGVANEKNGFSNVHNSNELHLNAHLIDFINRQTYEKDSTFTQSLITESVSHKVYFPNHDLKSVYPATIPFVEHVSQASMPMDKDNLSSKIYSLTVPMTANSKIEDTTSQFLPASTDPDFISKPLEETLDAMDVEYSRLKDHKKGSMVHAKQACNHFISALLSNCTSESKFGPFEQTKMTSTLDMLAPTIPPLTVPLFTRSNFSTYQRETDVKIEAVEAKTITLNAPDDSKIRNNEYHPNYTTRIPALVTKTSFTYYLPLNPLTKRNMFEATTQSVIKTRTLTQREPPSFTLKHKLDVKLSTSNQSLAFTSFSKTTTSSPFSSNSTESIQTTTFVVISKTKGIKVVCKNDENVTRSYSSIKGNGGKHSTKTVTTSYPPQNDVPWNVESLNIPMSDSKGNDSIAPKTKHYNNDPLIERNNFFSILGPTWKAAKTKWGISWEIHIYITGPLFALLAAYCAGNIVRIYMLPNLHCKGYFISLNFMMFIVGITRAVYLMHDSYNSNYSYPPVLQCLIFNICIPCLTSSFAILFLALLKVTKFRLLSPRIQRPFVLGSIITLHFSFTTITDIIVGSLYGNLLLLLICYFISFVWCIIVTGVFFSIFRKLHRAALRKQGEHMRTTFTRLHIDGADLPKHLPKAQLGLAVKLTLVTAIFSFLLSLINIYAIIYVFEYLLVDNPDPWLWWGFNFACRLLELAICITMTFVATHPVRHFKVAVNPTSSKNWHSCSVFMGCDCTLKDPMSNYSGHHSFRNPGFSSTLDDSGKTRSPKNLQLPLQTAGVETKSLSVLADDNASRNGSLRSSDSIKKSIRSIDLYTSDFSHDDLDKIKENCSLRRSVKSEKASMLYKENGFVRFRTDQDPEQPVDINDLEREENYEEECTNRFSTIANAGSVDHSTVDEDQIKKTMSQLYCADYFNSHSKRFSRASTDTAPGTNTSTDNLNNLTFVRNGKSHSAQEFPVFRYGSTCSSESAGNSFDVYLHDSAQLSIRNSVGHINVSSEQKLSSSNTGGMQYQEFLLSTSDNDTGDSNDLASEDCATRSLLSHGDLEIQSKADENLSFYSHCQTDSNSSNSSCAEGLGFSATNRRLCVSPDMRLLTTDQILSTVKSTPSSTDCVKSCTSKSTSTEAIPLSEKRPFCLKEEEQLPESGTYTTNRYTACPQDPCSTAFLEQNKFDQSKISGTEPVRKYKKASKSQSVDNLSATSANCDSTTRTKVSYLTLWKKVKGSTYSLNTSFHRYEPLADSEPDESRKVACEKKTPVVRRSASDRK